MTLPNITDQVRISPPFASVVVGRSPMIQWHNTRAGARRSALDKVRYGDPDRPDETRWDRFAHTDIGIATVAPNGAMVYVEEYPKGSKIKWSRDL